MKRWAVTGPIAAGKSSVSRLLAARGAAIVDADALGHRILAWPAVRARIAAAFGERMVQAEQVDRRALGDLVFADPGALARLNTITHGPLSRLAAAELARLEREERPVLAVLEAAVYFLLPRPPRMDLIISVVADPELRAQRLAARAGLDAPAAQRRIQAQAPMSGLWEQAEVVITNDGAPEQLAAAVDRIWRRQFPDRPRD